MLCFVGGKWGSARRRSAASAASAGCRAFTPPSPVFCAPALPPCLSFKIRAEIAITRRHGHVFAFRCDVCEDSGRFLCATHKRSGISLHFLCLVQASRHVQTPDNLPLCLTLFHPSPSILLLLISHPHSPTLLSDYCQNIEEK